MEKVKKPSGKRAKDIDAGIIEVNLYFKKEFN